MKNLIAEYSPQLADAALSGFETLAFVNSPTDSHTKDYRRRKWYSQSRQTREGRRNIGRKEKGVKCKDSGLESRRNVCSLSTAGKHLWHYWIERAPYHRQVYSNIVSNSRLFRSSRYNANSTQLLWSRLNDAKESSTIFVSDETFSMEENGMGYLTVRRAMVKILRVPIEQLIAHQKSLLF